MLCRCQAALLTCHLSCICMQVALFFGTGNQTPLVSSAVIARVFLDPDLKLFDYCPERLLNSVPVSCLPAIASNPSINLCLAFVLSTCTS